MVDLEKMEKNLKLNGFNYKYFKNREKLKDYLYKEINKDESIGVGGSMTIEELGIYKDLKNRGNKIYWHWDSDNPNESLRKAMDTDIYLSSTNAITEDGLLVNMDGTGNRVASMIFGHERVFIIAGKNKIAKDYDDAIYRIENIAGPKNGKRLNRKTPCAINGKCSDCYSEERMCNVETIIRKNPGGTRIYICLVDENLGY